MPTRSAAPCRASRSSPSCASVRRSCATPSRRLPDLKLLITTGARNKSIDLKAAAERGITVACTGAFGNPTIGITFGLILELTRRIGFENARMKAGAPWQVTIGHDIQGMTSASSASAIWGGAPPTSPRRSA